MVLVAKLTRARLPLSWSQFRRSSCLRASPCARVSSSAAYSQNALLRTLRTDAKASLQTSTPRRSLAPRAEAEAAGEDADEGPAAEVEGRKYPPFAAFRIHGTGRRKTAVARVGLIEGDGNIIVNNLSLNDYFQDQALLIQVGPHLRSANGACPSRPEHRKGPLYALKVLLYGGYRGRCSDSRLQAPSLTSEVVPPDKACEVWKGAWIAECQHRRSVSWQSCMSQEHMPPGPVVLSMVTGGF